MLKLTISAETYKYMIESFPAETPMQLDTVHNPDGSKTIELEDAIEKMVSNFRKEGESDDDLTFRVFSRMRNVN